MTKRKKKNVWYRGLIIIFSFILAAVFCEFLGGSLEQNIRMAFYSLKKDSIPQYNKTFIDKAGVPYVYYYPLNGITAGKQYNPTIIANQAILLFHKMEHNPDPVAMQQFRHCISWLHENLYVKRDAAIYLFNWQQPWYPLVKSPFTSGLSSGLAVEAFSCAQQLLPAEDHLQYAKALIRGFYLPIDQGGFTYIEKEGWWFEEFADSNKQTPRILDGHIAAVMGLQQYYLLTRDDSAKFLIDQGLLSLKHHLPAYDIKNEKVCYDIYCNPADEKYHLMLIGQMKELWKMTADSTFYHYYRKWNAPFEQPYVYRIFKQRNRSGIILYLLTSTMLIILLLISRKLLLRLYPGAIKKLT